MHIWVEFILSLLFVSATFTYDPQLVSCGTPGETAVVPVVAACLVSLTLTQKLGEKKKKKGEKMSDERKTGLFALYISQANSE